MFRTLKESLSNCHLSRIESRVNLGYPDCLLGLSPPGVFVMLELKVVQRGRKAGLSPHQVAFHKRHADLGCPTFVFLKYFPPKAPPEYRLYRGDQVLDLAVHGLDVAPAARWDCAKMEWEQLRQLLVLDDASRSDLH